jgi:hypothetical protein
MLAAYPSLTKEGYIKEPERVAIRVFAAAMASDKSQDNIHPNGVTSLQYVIATTCHDEMLLQQGVQNALEDLFGKYFDTAKFDVEVEDLPNQPGRKNIIVKGLLISGGVKYTLARMLATKDNVIDDFKEITYS